MNRIIWLFVGLALGAYTLPWLITSATSLTSNAYDLAEWASLHPAVRTSPLLVTSLLLRLQPVLLALMAALSIQRPLTRAGCLQIVLVLIIAAGLLPPLEFFSSQRDDINYQQQFILSFVVLVSGGLVMSRVVQRYARFLVMACAIIGIITSIIGLIQVSQLLQQFRLVVHAGVGGVLLVICYGLIMVTMGMRIVNEQGRT